MAGFLIAITAFFCKGVGGRMITRDLASTL
jgi:hypothetical protein